MLGALAAVAGGSVGKAFFGSKATKDQGRAINRANAEKRRLVDEAIGMSDEAYQDALAKIQSDPRKYAGLVPKVAVYEQVKLAESQGRSIDANTLNLESINGFTSQGNQQILDQDLQRIRELIPNYDELLAAQTRNALTASQGQVSNEQLSDILSNNAGMAAQLGRVGGGNVARMTARDLGIASLDLQNRGQSMFASLIDNANRVSNPNRLIDPRTYFVNPSQALNLDLTQAQLLQNNQQDINNAAAAPDPAALKELDLSLTNALNKAALTTEKAALVKPDATAGINSQFLANLSGQVANAGMSVLGGGGFGATGGFMGARRVGGF